MHSVVPYRSEIDGLRSLAVVPVILFHAGFKTFSGGFVGVDVFFVISGYLITSLIARDLAAGSFSFLDFYERRARRILPALFVVMACCVPFAWAWMNPGDLKGFAKSILFVLGFASNILFWTEGGYFDAAAESKPLLHTWSLAVEEQFYIVFPVVLLLLWRFGRRSTIASVAIGALASLAFSEYASRYFPGFNFYSALTRAWELAAGALCALAVFRPHAIRDNLLSALGLGAICVAIFAFDGATHFPSVYALLPVIGTAFVLAFGIRGTMVARLLSQRLFVGVGLISYSAYLWHQPLLAFARIRLLDAPPPTLMGALALASFPLAWCSWRFVETPVRSFKREHWAVARPRVFGLFGAVGAALLAFGFAGRITAGFPARIPEAVRDLPGYAVFINPRSQACMSLPDAIVEPAKSCVYGDADHPTFALLGDSHAVAMIAALGERIGRDGAGLRELSYVGCPPVDDYFRRTTQWVFDCVDYTNKALEFIRTNKDIGTVILVARWTMYLEGKLSDNQEGGVEAPAEIGSHFVGLDVANPTPDDIRNFMGQAYRTTVRKLMSWGKRVVLVYPIPEAGWNVPQYLYKAKIAGAIVRTPLSTREDVFREATAATRAQLDRIPDSSDLLRIYPERVFCDHAVKDRCIDEAGGKPLYADEYHLSTLGSAMLSDYIATQLQNAGWLGSKDSGR